MKARMKLQNKKIGSIRTFFDRLEKLNLDNHSEDIFYFCGHSDHEGFKLEPSIYRDPKWIEDEHRIFREIVMKCPNDFSGAKTTFEKLVKMQHYSLPTRLLDLTSNPLVALFFAANQYPDKDGKVLIFKVPMNEIKYYDSDTVSILANLAKRPKDFDIEKIRDLEENSFNQEEHIKYLLHEIKEEKPYFEPVIDKKDIESVVCVKPKLDNPRIIRQDGAFFIFGINGKKTIPAKIPDDYLVTDESSQLIIKEQKGKEKILTQLARLGINEATMFPEIDSVSKYIKEKLK